MQLFSPQIRLSTTISLTFLQGSEPHQMGQISENSPQRSWICVPLAVVFRPVVYGEPTKSSLKFIRHKIHPMGLQCTWIQYDYKFLL